MTQQTPHIVGLGNALVDVVAPVEHDVIGRHGLTPGGMHLVDAEAARVLFEDVAPGVRQSGGSVANSMAHAAELGCRSTYLGKTARDELGETFRADMDVLGVAQPIPAAATESGTGRCVVLVTPDGERTMSTYLGAAVELHPDDIAGACPEACDILFVEGYLWDAPHGAEAIAEAAGRARAAGARVALTPSDPGCAERNRAAMSGFLAEHADILVGNRDEVSALAGGAPHAEAALDWAMKSVAAAAVTDSANGSWVAADGTMAHVHAVPVTEVVDSTGAGDAFAAGFLAALARRQSAPEAGRLGARQAAQVLGHYGARDGAAAEALSFSAA